MTALFTALLLTGATPAPALEVPVTTQTRAGTAGDPVNVLLIGTQDELITAFCMAGWSPADPITLRSAVRMGRSVVFDRPYPQAPVSNLYLFGRTQDVAFERAVGGSARTRHHVRFWLAGCAPDGRSMWVGAGTFDLRVGRSPATGRLTHRIDPAVDVERDTILGDLQRAGWLAESARLERSGPFVGRNGEGDCYFTDGAIAYGVLTPRPCATVVVPARGLRRR